MGLYIQWKLKNITLNFSCIERFMAYKTCSIELHVAAELLILLMNRPNSKSP